MLSGWNTAAGCWRRCWKVSRDSEMGNMQLLRLLSSARDRQDDRMTRKSVFKKLKGRAKQHGIGKTLFIFVG